MYKTPNKHVCLSVCLSRGSSKKIREKTGEGVGGQEKHFSTTLNWHNVVILKKIAGEQAYIRHDTNLLQTFLLLKK